MLKPPRIIDSKHAAHPVVAGSGSGIKVYCHRKSLPMYKLLVKLANSGNHHARLAVSGIAGLSSGHLHMDNVYHNGNKANGTPRRKVYLAVLPGIQVLYTRQDDGTFFIGKIALSDLYTQQQSEVRRPGLWRASKNQDQFEWKAAFVEDGKLDPGHRNRFVIIADRTSKKPNFVATEIFETLKSSRDATTVSQIHRDGFDLHHTPGTRRIGGWRHLRETYLAHRSKTLEESAELLARTMRHASDISGVVWGSEGGGAGILTQAMQILADQGVTLNKHGLFLNRATTLPSRVQALARRLGIESKDITKKSTLSLDQLAGQLCFFDTPLSHLERLKNDDDYTLGGLARDATQGGFDIIKNTHTTLGAAGLFGFAVASSPVIAQVGGILALTSLAIKTVENVAPEASRRPLFRPKKR